MPCCLGKISMADCLSVLTTMGRGGMILAVEAGHRRLAAAECCTAAEIAMYYASAVIMAKRS